MSQLPQEFVERMKDMLGEEYAEFEKSYDAEKYQALRLNPLKVKKENFLKQNPFHLTPVPWEKNGFYYEAEDRPGKHAYHEAGVYYMQEPSAMAPAAYLQARPAGGFVRGRTGRVCVRSVRGTGRQEHAAWSGNEGRRTVGLQ